jgi:thioesterase domain-containing protein
MIAILDAWPPENTINYFLYHIHLNWRSLQRLLRRARCEGPNWMIRKLWMLLGGLRSKSEARVSESVPGKGSLQSAHQPGTTFQNAIRKRFWPVPTFVPPTFSGRLTLLKIAKQPYWRVNDPLLGWATRALGGVEVHIIPGEHGTILREPNVQVLAAILSGRITQTMAESPVQMEAHS